MRTIAICLMALMLGACSNGQYSKTGQDIIKTGNAYRLLTSGSYHGAGLEERLGNCVRDIFDPANRGSGCN